MSTKEQWKEFADGFYEVSDKGRIRRAKPGVGTHVGRILKTCPTNIGYPHVSVKCNGERKTYLVHCLVAEAFIGTRPEGLEVNHRDGDKTNNNVSNLEYVSHIENTHHAMRTGLRHTKIPQETVDRVRFLRNTGLYYKDIAKETGVSAGYCQRLAVNEFRKRP